MNLARIDRVAFRGFRVPLRAPFNSSRGSYARREGLLVFVHTSDGNVGLGEASPLPGVASVPDTAAVIQAFGEQMIGRTPLDAWHSLGREPAGIPRPAIAAGRFALETAVASLVSEAAAMSLAGWLAQTCALPGPSTTVPVNALLGERPGTPVGATIGDLASRGFTAFKMKVGLDPVIDVSRIAEARAALGPDAEIRLDANQAWAFDDARAVLASAAPYAISFCEEPIRPGPGHLQELARLRDATGVRVAVDESCHDVATLQAVIDAKAADVVVLKPAVTGLREALGMLGLARSANLAAVVTSNLDTGVAVTAAAHLASLIPAPIPACGLATLDLLEDDLVLDPPALASGCLTVPDGPGLGVACDRDALARFATDLSGTIE